MSNPRAALAELGDRIAEARADGSLSSERAVQLRAVEPLLEVLGWDVRGGGVVPAATVEGQEVDYLLAVDDTAGVLVGTAAPGEDLEVAEIARVERGIADGNATRGIATDGGTVVLLVEHDGEVHRRSFPFGELPDHAEALGRFHRSVVARSTAVDRADRRAAARRLAENRAAVVESIAETILTVAEEPVEGDVVAEAERTVDALVETFRGEDAGAVAQERSDVDDPDDDSERVANASGSKTESTGPDPADEASSDAPARTERGAEGPSDLDTGSSDVDTGSSDAAGGEAPATAADGEYVVRFFGGSSSVGAVGTETPRGTTVGTVRYLLENHGLDSSITVPWRDGDGTVVLAEEPGGDGWTTLSNAAGHSICVRPVDDPETARRAIDGLVEAAGLRAMFQGDW